MEEGDVGHISEPPSRTFGPNPVGGDCFFRCIETASAHSVHSQRVDIPLAMKGGGDLELYRYIPGCSEGDSASVIDTNAGDGQVSDDAIHRAQVVAAEMEFCRDATDLAGLRSAVVRSRFRAPLLQSAGYN